MLPAPLKWADLTMMPFAVERSTPQAASSYSVNEETKTLGIRLARQPARARLLVTAKALLLTGDLLAFISNRRADGRRRHPTPCAYAHNSSG